MSKDKLHIEVFAGYYFSDDSLNEFSSSIQKSGALIKVNKSKKYTIFNSSSGEELPDLVIWITNYKTEILVSAVSSLFYDLLKVGIANLWKKLQTISVKKMTSEKVEDKKKSIVVKVELDEKRRVEFYVTGNLSDKQVECLMERAFDILEDKQSSALFSKPEIIDKTDEKERISMSPNSELIDWEPLNFENFRRKLREMELKFEEDLFKDDNITL